MQYSFGLPSKFLSVISNATSKEKIFFLMGVNFFAEILSYTKFNKEKGGVNRSCRKQKIHFKQKIGGMNHD